MLYKRILTISEALTRRKLPPPSQTWPLLAACCQSHTSVCSFSNRLKSPQVCDPYDPEILRNAL